MREKIERLKCDFCGQEIDEMHTYSTGPNITDLSYTINYYGDYVEDSKKEHFDICSECRMELIKLICSNARFKKLFTLKREQNV